MIRLPCRCLCETTSSLVPIAPSVTAARSSFQYPLSSGRAFSTNSLLPFDNSRHVILVLWDVHLCLKISRHSVDKLEKCKHTFVGSWHDTLRESRFARGEAITAELPATSKRRLNGSGVYEVGTATLIDRHN